MERPAGSRYSVTIFGSYVLAFLVTLAVTGILFLLRGSIKLSIVALLYLLPVGFSTALFGLGPGILAALTAFLALNYFFIPPYHSLLVYEAQDVLALVIFLAVAVVISQLVGKAQKSLEAAQLRERESARLYELTRVLAGLQDPQVIVQTVARLLKETFQTWQVEVLIEAGSDHPSVQVSLQGDQLPSPQPASGPSLLVPLETAHGLVGEFRLWRDDAPFTPEERRLLQAYASQVVLVLERAWLAQADTRARMLEESDRMKSSLLSSVSHELRTPLATIKAAATSLRSEAVDWDSEARNDLLAAVEEETDHLNHLVSNLLDMSRIEMGSLKPRLQWNVLDEILAGVIHRLHGQQHIIQVDIPEDLPLIPVDYMMMDQVFANLLDNSLKYSPTGTAIRISARVQDHENLLVQVDNQGPPVPEEDLDRIFDKFHRVTAADQVTGTGLGLSICKGIIEAHGGRIWAENQPGGFAFKFTLPLSWEGATPRLPVE